MRLIDADAIVQKLVTHGEPGGDYMLGLHEGINTARKLIDNAPTIDPVKPGRWVEHDDDMECSECGETWNYVDNCTETFVYCPNCGAKMEEQP